MALPAMAMTSPAHHQQSIPHPLLARASERAPAAQLSYTYAHRSSRLSSDLSQSHTLAIYSSTMPRFFLFCLVSSQLAATAVMARPFATVLLDGGVTVAESPYSAPAFVLHAHSLLEGSRFAGSPMSSHHAGGHRPFDSKFAGGKIIVAGLAAAIFVAIFCYIRITRKKNVVEPKV